jgi:hypothetical protein
MMIEKKGEMTSRQIVILIIIIVSFLIILLLYGLYQWEPSIDAETCHESIVLRSSFNLGIIKGTDIIPLKCRTEKICLSMEGGDCGFGDASKDNPVTRVKLSKDKKKAQEKLMQVIADELYDCHSMVGRGELHFMPNKFYEKNYCLICSRIALDETAKENLEDISYVELYSFMKNRGTVDGGNYLKATYEVEKTEDMILMLEKVRQLINEATEQNIEAVKDLKIDVQKENAIIVQMMTTGTWDTWVATIGSGVLGGVLVAGGIVAAPFSLGSSLTISAVGVGVIAGGATGGILYSKSNPDGTRYIYPAIYPYDIRSLYSLKCSSFETAP